MVNSEVGRSGRSADDGTPRPRRVTIADVARRAGVSAASVSYALNGGSGVSERRRREIEGVAAELGWRPSRLARQLRTGVQDVIGLLLVDIANPFYPEIASGVIAAAGERGFEVFVSHVGIEGKHQAEAARTHVDRQAAGLLFTSLIPDDLPLLEELTDRGTPFVQLYRRVDSVAADSVGINDMAAGHELGRHMASIGRSRIAIIAGPENSSASRDRGLGFRAGLAVGGVSATNEESMWGPMTRSSGFERARRLLLDEGGIDAVMCGNDVMALGVLDACRELGRRVPEDIAVSGFDDMSFASAGPLQLTTVTVPRELMGRRGVEMLIDRINGNREPARSVTLPYTLRTRATTGT